MSQHTASTPTASPAHDGHDSSFTSSQGSPPDMSASSFESSFRLRMPIDEQKPECEKHPKGKRKRTTTQDKSFLEAAYNSNPKPDKAARLDIVKRVSLNEKEVQIWFQNRRQNDRRKSRPLSPQELAQFGLGSGMRVISSGDMSTPADALSAPMAVPSAAKLPVALPSDTVPAVESDGSLDLGRTNSHDLSLSQSQSQPQSPASSPASAAETTGISSSQEAGISQVESPKASPTAAPADTASLPPQATPVPTGYLANRWNIQSSTPPVPIGGDASDESLGPVSFSSSISSNAENLPSNISLSILLDGKAEVVSFQPSPPRPTPYLSFDTTKLPCLALNTPRTLQRSHSALPSITLPPISDLLPPQLTRGRSRDVHAWESVCDADRRDELTRQAENEASGSAVAAISLVRSSSSSASLSNLIHNHQAQSRPGPAQSSQGRRNVSATQKISSGDGAVLESTKRTLQQIPSLSPSENQDDIFVSVEPEADEEYEPGKKRQKQDGNGFVTILSPAGDSDKENWSPGKDGNSRRRPAPGSPSKLGSLSGSRSPKPNPRRTGRVLGEQDENSRRLYFDRPRAMNRAITAPSSTSSRPRKAGGGDVFVFEDGEANEERKAGGVDHAVERFMRGEISPSKRPDMDCVEGLLSLSQGNWR